MNMKITFLGDLFPADLDFTIGFGIKSKFENSNVIDLWKQNISQFSSDSDLLIANLESPLIGNSFAKKKSFYGNPMFADFLNSCGINVLNIANNHILEHGVDGYNNTKKHLFDSNIAFIGDGNKNLYIVHDNVKIGLAGFNSVDLDTFPSNNTFSVLTRENVDKSLDDMLNNNVDIKIFCFHWGNEYINRPSKKQIALAHYLVDRGADIIIGHHPHVIQSFEKYNDGYIFYSLGNFCFDNPFQSKQFSNGMGVSFIIENNRISSIDMFGVKLSFDELVNKMNMADFNKLVNKNQDLFDSYVNSDNYEYYYNKDLKINRFKERVRMKLSWFKLFIVLNNYQRKLFFRNIVQMYK